MHLHSNSMMCNGGSRKFPGCRAVGSTQSQNRGGRYGRPNFFEKLDLLDVIS